MAYQNGRIPRSALAPIGNGYYLRRDAALAFNAMSAAASKRYGTHLYVVSAYRPYSKQVELWNLYRSGRGNLAAVPGNSNHGLGLAIDLSSTRYRYIVDKIGRYFGFSKACSDAQSEWWHIVYNPSCTHAGFHPRSSSSMPTLRLHSRGNAVKTLQNLLNAHIHAGLKRDGDFGKGTLVAVKYFQKVRHMKQDGVVGPSTWNALHRWPKH